MLCAAVAVVAWTGIEPFVIRLTQWLTSLMPAYDPLMTMVILVVAALIRSDQPQAVGAP